MISVETWPAILVEGQDIGHAASALPILSLIPLDGGRYKSVMKPRAVRELASHLASDEKLLWAGSPDPLRYALHGFGLSGAGAVLIAVLVVIWWLLVLVVIGPLFEPGLAGLAAMVVGIPLFFVICGLAVGPIRRWREARHVAYGLTDRRAVTLIGGKHSRIEEAPPTRIGRPVVTRHRNGTRTVLFYRPARPRDRENGAGEEEVRDLRGFIAIREGEALEAEIAGLRGRN
jgi:hypothetical protein